MWGGLFLVYTWLLSKLWTSRPTSVVFKVHFQRNEKIFLITKVAALKKFVTTKEVMSNQSVKQILV